MTTVSANYFYINTNCYKNCQNITTVDLRNVQWVGNSMYNSFYNCSNLTDVTNISNTVTNMEYAFSNCSKINKIPTLPNSVTSLSYSFSNCSNITSVTIPNSVSDISYTFYNCSNLKTISTIPNSITNMVGTFDGCVNISNVYIKSENITNAVNCFDNCSDKNVYIPFKYDNGVNSLTYNSFIQAGYDDVGTVNNIKLYNISELYLVSDEEYTVTVQGNTLYLNTYIGIGGDVRTPWSKE